MKESRESRVRPLKKQILSKISLFFSALKKKGPKSCATIVTGNVNFLRPDDEVIFPRKG